MVNMTNKRKQEINKNQEKVKNKVNNKRDMKRKKTPCIDLSPRITMASLSHKS